MAENVGYATLNVIPSMKGFGKALTSGIKGPMSSAGAEAATPLAGGLGKALGPLMAAAGAAAMGAFIGSAISAAGDLEQSIGAVDSVFKTSAGQMHEWATGAATSVGLARNEYNELATIIGSQLKNAGTSMEDLAPKTDELIGLGADLSAMFGGSTAEAVSALSSALKGERDPIERYGVSLNEAKIQAEMAAQASQGLTFASEEQAKAAATLALITKQTADAHGASAREANTFQGVMSRLSASWQNVTTTIGQGFLPFATAAGSVLLGLMPAIQGVADNFAIFGERMGAAFQGAGGGLEGVRAMFSELGTIISDWVAGGGITRAFESFATARETIFNSLVSAAPAIIEGLSMFMTSAITFITGTVIPQIGSLVSTLVPQITTLITTVLPSLVQAILTALPQLLGAGIMLFSTLVDSLVVVIPQIVGSLTAMLPQIVGAIVGALPQLLAAGLLLFQSLITALTQALPSILNAILGALPSILGTLMSMLPSLINTGVTLFLALITAITTALPQIIQAVLAMLPRFIETLLGMIPALIDAAVQLFVALVKAIPVVLPQILQALVDMGPSLFQAVVSLVPVLLDAGKDIMQGLIDGIVAMGGAVWDAIGGVVSGAIDWAKGLLGIHSPSRVFREFGEFTGEGFAIGIDRMGSTVASSARGLANSATSAMEGALDALDRSTGSRAWTISANAVPEGGLIGAQTRVADAVAAGGSPLVGELTLQSTGDIKSDLDETLFHLRRIRRGGRHAA